MFCKNCGAQLPDDAKFCLSCGHSFQDVKPNTPAQPTVPVQPIQSAPPLQNPASVVDTNSIWTFGILGLICACIFGVSVIGIILGRIAMNQATLHQTAIGPLSPKAHTGFVLGKIGFIAGIITSAIFAIYLTGQLIIFF